MVYNAGMGFRFRRSVKLFPGVRMNISTRGTSFSVGGRGATVNLSARGTRTTFSVPGTGLSWTQTSRTTSARRQVASSARAASREEARRAREQAKAAVTAQSEAQAERIAQEHFDIVNAWRDAPAIPVATDFQNALQRSPFVPSALPEALSDAAIEEQLRAELRTTVPQPTSRAWLGVAVACLVGFIVLRLEPQLGWTTLCLLPVFAWLQLRSRGQATVDTLIGHRANELLPERIRNARLEHAHQIELATAANARRKQEWDTLENDRIGWATRIVAGDREALEEALGDTLEDLDFPFETSCKVAVPNSNAAYVLLDLPEIENVIPEKKPKVLKSGLIKMVKRSATERNEAYAHLATGLAILIARATFGVGPTLEVVNVAAYTQRRNGRTGLVQDDFVYEVALSKQTVAITDMMTIEPVGFLSSANARLNKSANGTLKRITEPAWIDAPAS